MTTAPAPPPRTPPSAPPQAAAAYSETGWPVIAREGWPIVGFIGGATLVLIVLFKFFFGAGGFAIAVLIGAPVTLWALWFFRDPARQTPSKPGLVVSPADGVVCFIGPSSPPAEMGMDSAGMTRVSIFMNIFNVHVNRSPCEAVVEGVHYRAGAFFNASFDKASEQNERCGLVLRLADGRRIGCVQIAGLIARRIVCRAKAQDALRAGQRFGMIRFGSRLDIYLPAGVAAKVHIGQKTVAGETELASLGETR